LISRTFDGLYELQEHYAGNNDHTCAAKMTTVITFATERTKMSYISHSGHLTATTANKQRRDNKNK